MYVSRSRVPARFVSQRFLQPTGMSGLGAASMTPQQVYNLVRSVGFPPAQARLMVAIAKNESNYNPGMRCNNCLGVAEDSIGLFQINMGGALGVARLAQFGISDKSALYDPLTNARAAASIWAGNDANLNAAWSINRDTGIPPSYSITYRQKMENALASIPSGESLEAGYSGGSVGGSDLGVSCAQVLRQCPDGSTVGYDTSQPGCVYLPCPAASSPVTSFDDSWIYAAAAGAGLAVVFSLLVD